MKIYEIKFSDGEVIEVSASGWIAAATIARTVNGSGFESARRIK